MRTAREAPVPAARLRLWAALGSACVLLGQYLIVQCNYQGDWNALFYEGARYPAAPELAWECHHRFRDNGYDGQIYHLIAHDPSPDGALSRYVDAPRLRYRRILVPAAAHVLALGRPQWIDAAYRLVVLVCVFMGTYWTATYAALAGRSAAWGMAFVLLPAVIISAERMTVDVALAALTAAFAVYGQRERPWALFAVLALASLARETGVLLTLAACVTSAVRKDARRAALALLALAPAAAWYAFVHTRTRPYDYPTPHVPLSGIVGALRTPTPAPVVRAGQVGEWWRATILQKPALDRLALLGAIASFVLAVYCWVRRRPLTGLGTAAALFAVLGILVQRPDNWLHVYDFGRVYSPLLLLLALRGLQEGNAWAALPWALMLPRILVELAMPIVGVLRAFLWVLDG